MIPASCLVLAYVVIFLSNQDYGLDSLPTVEPVYGNIDTQSALSQPAAAASYASDQHKMSQPPPTSRPRSFFTRLFGRGDPVLNDEGNERRKEAFIEDAMDREKVIADTGWPI